MDNSSEKKDRLNRLNRFHHRIAVALKHDWTSQPTPKVVATGKGEFAERIIHKAEESNVPIQKDDLLAQALQFVEVDREIPPELYGAVAKILSFLYRVDNQAAKEAEKA